MSKIQNLSVISFLSFNIIVGFLIFSRGFLLNRKVIPEKSIPCVNNVNNNNGFHSEIISNNKNNNNNQSNSNNGNNNNEGRIAFDSSHIRSLSSTASWCNPHPTHTKLILILLDALRFDFVDRMKFLSRVSKFQESNLNGISSCKMKFLADPPTTTMQRLKALMTGTMPTFIDASANFNSYEVEEDSLIYQLYAAGKKIAFLGDDTWLSLFSKKLFDSPYVEAHPSFNAWDLDTVDKAVTGTLKKMFGEEQKSNWDVLIAHLLGVDHCGHRYGPNHKEMTRKLDDADNIIEFVFNSMSHDTMLVIFGDHGMTKTGDHGGDSTDEVESAVIFLTKQLKRNKQINPPFHCHSTDKQIQTISQIDLVPTLSSLYGIPIPYSSIGQIIPDFLVNKVYSDAIAANVAQVQKYIQKYSTLNGANFHGITTQNEDEEESSNLFEAYERVEEAFMEYQNNRNPSTRANLHHSSQNYLTKVKTIALTTWTQFDVTTIYIGILITFLSLLCLTIYVENLPSLNNKTTKYYYVFHWLWPSLTHWSVLSTFFFNLSSAGFAGIIVSSFSGLIVFLITLLYKLFELKKIEQEQNHPNNGNGAKPKTTTTTNNFKHNNNHKNTSYNNNNSNNKKKDLNLINIRQKQQQPFLDLNFAEIGTILLYSFTCLGVFSNSYVINEGYILSAVLLAVILLHLLCSKEALKNIFNQTQTTTSNEQTEENEELFQQLLINEINSNSNSNNNKLASLKRLFRCSWSCFFILAIIVRVGHLFFRCREELINCEEGYLLHKQLSSLPSEWLVHKYVRYGAALLSLAIFVVIFRHWTILRKCTASSERLAALIANYIPTLLVVLICVFWALQGLPFVNTSEVEIRPLLNNFPLVYQTVTIVSLIIIWIKPICCIGRVRTVKKMRKKIMSEVRKNNSIANNNKNSKNQLSQTQNGSILNNSNSNGALPNNSNNNKNEKISKLGQLGQNEEESSSKGGGGVSHSTFKLLEILSLDALSEDVFSSSLLTFGTLVTLLLVQVSSSGISPSITLAAYSCVALIGIFRRSSSHKIDSWTTVIGWTLASQYFFYATGHQPIFSAIPWDSAFVTSTDGVNLGDSDADSWTPWISAGLAVLGNLHVSQIIFSTFLPLLAYWRVEKEKPESLMGHNELEKAYILGGKYLILHAFKLLFCMICACWQRRHLMVWKIFAPKFIFEMISFIVTLGSVSFSLIFLTRIDYLFQKVLAKEKMAS